MFKIYFSEEECPLFILSLFISIIVGRKISVKSKILPSIVLLLIFCMCTKENQLLNPNVNDVLMPLKIGNFWEYKTESDKIIKESIDSLYVKNGINI